MKVAICSCGVFNLHPCADYVSVTNKIKDAYCKVHENVDFIWSSEPMHEDRDPHFARFSLMLYAFSKGYDWAVWMDCDAAPVNFRKDIAEWLSKKDQDRMIIEDDVLGLNSGVMAIPNTEECIKWLVYMDSEEIYEKYKGHQFMDQDAIADSLENPEYSHLREKPEHKFGLNHYENIYKWYIKDKKTCPNEYKEGDFCLHIAGYADTYRRLRFQKVLDEIENFMCPVCNTPMTPYVNIPLNMTFEGMASDDLIIGEKEEQCIFCKCPHCGIIYSPEMAMWEYGKRRKYIFNEHYADVCKSYGSKFLEDDFTKALLPTMIMRGDRVVDLGCLLPGLCDRLEVKNVIWADKKDMFFEDTEHLNITNEFKYTAALAINSLERMTDPNAMFAIARELLCKYGQLIVHSPIWDKLSCCSMKTPDKWDIIAPRCGIISVFSEKSLEIMASRFGFNYLKEKSNGNLAIFEKTLW